MFSSSLPDPSQDSPHSLLLITSVNSNHRVLVEEYVTAEQVDTHWYDFAETGVGIELVRDIQQQSQFRPYQGQSQFYVLLHVDKASLAAQNALLKIVESTSSDSFILTTDTQSAVLPTIQSRCQIKMHTETSEIPAETHQQFIDLYQKIKNSSYAELITLSDEYSDREEATTFLRNLIVVLHSHLEKSPSAALVKHLQILQSTLTSLSQNVNVKLAIEHGLFAIKQSTMATGSQ